MGYHFKLLVCLFTIVLATHSYPASKDEVSTTTDLAKRQPPEKYQLVTVQLEVFRAAIIVLNFVWDCVVERFVTRTSGAGTTTFARLPNSIEITTHPDGVGVIQPGSPGNPYSRRRTWVFGGQPFGFRLATTLNDNDDLVLTTGDWNYPEDDLISVTATDYNRFTDLAQIISISVEAPEAGDPHNPPSAEGEGFGTSSNNSVAVPPEPTIPPLLKLL